MSNGIKKIRNEVIAEIGSVHNGSLALAKKLIKKAAECGADTVKFQLHLSEFETLKDAPSPDYFKKENRYEYFNRINFSQLDWLEIKKFCELNKVEFLCSPFSIEAVDILEKLNVKRYKVPSGEVTNLPLLEKLKSTKKPVLLSTGMSNFKEIDDAYKILKKNKLTIMQCSSIYPCPLDQVGLNVIEEFKKRYKNCNIGFSDHSNGYSASILSAHLGATIFEKHFTLSKKMYGSDAKNSMEPKEFKHYCDEIKNIYLLKKKVNKNKLTHLKKMKHIFQKSIVAKENIKKNSVIKKELLAYKKPGDGISASKYKLVIGKISKINIKKDKKIKWINLK